MSGEFPTPQELAEHKHDITFPAPERSEQTYSDKLDEAMARAKHIASDEQINDLVTRTNGAAADAAWSGRWLDGALPDESTALEGVTA